MCLLVPTLSWWRLLPGNGVTIAAGTTVTRDIAENELVLSRAAGAQAGLETPCEEEVTDLPSPNPLPKGRGIVRCGVFSLAPLGRGPG